MLPAGHRRAREELALYDERPAAKTPRLSAADTHPAASSWRTPAAAKSLLRAPQRSFAASVFRKSPAGPRFGGARAFPSPSPWPSPLGACPRAAHFAGHTTHRMASASQQRGAPSPLWGSNGIGIPLSAQPPAHVFSQPPSSAVQRGFGGSKLLLAARASASAGIFQRSDLIELLRSVRPDAAPAASSALSTSAAPDALEQASSTQSSVAIAAEAARRAAQRAAELAAGPASRELHLRASASLEDTAVRSRLQRDIELCQEHVAHLSMTRPPPARQPVAAPPLVDSGLVPLSEEQNVLVEDTLAPGGPRSEVLVSASFKAFGDLDVTRQNFECMREGKWLNDEVINFYLALLQERELRKDGTQPRVHFHNTFFYNKLYADSGQYNYKAVARWTSLKKIGYCILDCDLVVVPVHQDVHWVLAVIDMRQRQVRYYDSLGGVDHSCMANLARYIADESQHKRETALDAAEWQRIAPNDIPEQKNGCDCGVFMLKYADWLARQAPLSFSQRDMPYFRSRIVAEVRQKLAA